MGWTPKPPPRSQGMVMMAYCTVHKKFVKRGGVMAHSLAHKWTCKYEQRAINSR